MQKFVNNFTALVIIISFIVDDKAGCAVLN